MARRETPIPKEKPQEIIRSVRVFTVAPIRSEQLEEFLESGKTAGEISLVEVVLAQKADTQLVTAIGGRIQKDEDLVHAGMRKVFQESLLTRESLRNIIQHDWHGTPIPYLVTRTGELCEATLMVMPVRSGTVSLHEPRENNNADSVYKIEKLVAVTPQELHQLFNHGSIETTHGKYHMFGHLTEAPSRDVFLDAEGRSVQLREFERILSEVSAYEVVIREEVLTEINRVRRWHKKPAVSTLGACSREEIVRGFQAAKWMMGMHDEHVRDMEGGNMPPRSADVLTASLYLREFAPKDFSEALVSMPTVEVRRARNVFKYALRGTVIELYDRMGKDIRPFMSKKNLFPLHLRDIADFVRRKPTSLSYMNTVAALQALWPEVIALPLVEHTALLKILDDRFTDELVRKLGKPREVVLRALALPYEIPRHIAAEMQKIKDTFQENHPVNEVASAIERPFVQILHILGLHPYEIIAPELINDAVTRTRGEMLMILSAFFTAIPVVEKQIAADNSLFEAGLARFLVYPPELDEIKLKNIPHTIFRRETEKPVGRKELQLWYDKRPLKSEVRTWFKSLQGAVIYDAFSHNFVIRDANFSAEELRNIPLRLDMVTHTREALFAHFRKEFEGSGYEVSIVEGTLKTESIDTVRAFIATSSKKQRQQLMNEKKGGKRPGSIGNSIVREKFILSFRKGNEVQYTEICIYPFETIQVDGSPLAMSEFMGFEEKLKDDRSGRYGGYRLIQTDPNDPTAPSPLELWSPAAWSRSRFEDIKLLQHKPKKKRKNG